MTSDEARILLLCTPGGFEQTLVDMSRPQPVFALGSEPAGPPPPEAVATGVELMPRAGVELAVVVA